MRKLVLSVLIVQSFVFANAQIIVDHRAVDEFDSIPELYIDAVKTMLVDISGESHSRGYRHGMYLLEMMDNTYQVQTYDYQDPVPSSTDQYLRIGQHLYMGEDYFFSQEKIADLKSQITTQSNTGNPFDVMGFGWCWDMTWHNDPGGDLDPVYQVRWAGSSVGGPQGDMRWGLDSDDQALTGNSVSMDTYLEAVESYQDYCEENSLPTRWIYTTGPVDDVGGTENGFQREIKHDYIRTHVMADASRILFDYADILCWNNEGEQHMVDWNDGGDIRSHAQIHPNNMMDYDASWNTVAHSEDGDHIGEVGTVRLAKAMWWMLARMAGWDGVPLLVSEIRISAEGDPLEVPFGSVMQLTASVLPEAASNKAVDWSLIEMNGSATITSSGLFSAGDPGTVVVVASALDQSGVSDSLQIIISSPIQVSEILISSQGGVNELPYGGTLQYTASVLPDNAVNKEISWSVVPGTGSATISASGLLTAGNSGTVKVVATALDGSGVADTVALAIAEAPIPVSQINVSPEGGVTQLLTGENLLYSAEILPVDAADKEISWSVVSGSGTATIDTEGLLTARNPGDVIVMATALDGSGVSGNSALSILAPVIPVSSLELSSAGNVNSLDSGDDLQFSVTVMPADATNKDVDWSVINGTGSAIISPEGLLFAGNPGTVAVVVRATDGSVVSDTFYLTIRQPLIPVNSITVSAAGDQTSIESGSKLQFFAELMPQDASNRELDWSISGGTGSATISEEGLLTAGNPGLVTVLATAMDGSYTRGSFVLTITVPIVMVSDIVLSSGGDVAEVESGTSLQFSALVLPMGANNTELAWSVIEETGTASVSGTGLLVAGNPGDVTVVASAQDGSGVSGSFKLSILSPVISVSRININVDGGVSVLEEGKMVQLHASVGPSNASNRSVLWTVAYDTKSSGTGTVTPEGMFIALSGGEADVFAVAQDGSGVFDQITLTVTPSGPVSIRENESESLSLYPNPGSGQFFLNTGNMEVEMLQVINATGSVLLEFSPDTDQKIIELNLSRERPGVYFIRIFSADRFIVKQAIISR
jgi:uncharacterized protein YjdB